MMKVLIITGSHRPKQVSYGLAVKLTRLLRRNKSVVTEILELADKKVDDCCATAACSKTKDRRCINNEDDFNGIFNKMAAHDAIFFIIPKYAPYPSRFMSLFERIVAISWWGFNAKNILPEFILYKKIAGVIGFANSPVTGKETFQTLFDSFKSVGFKLLPLGEQTHGLFINRSNENEDELLERVSQVFNENAEMGEFNYK